MVETELEDEGRQTSISLEEVTADGVVECRRIFCPPANCSKDALAVHVNGTCCKKCRPKCTYMGQSFSEGQRFLSKSCRECKNGLMAKVAETCPELNCTLVDRILPDNRCCNVCKGYDFCAEGLVCGENSDCKNRNTRGECECQSGYASAHGDSTYCQAADSRRSAETQESTSAEPESRGEPRPSSSAGCKAASDGRCSVAELCSNQHLTALSGSSLYGRRPSVYIVKVAA
ncbi:hypothetical protein NHX12_005708 [Muraenolepis orangiensis]|uniref:Uncharacterized protein n=1 Tax=Muraenolepis orangiensis TaxID=630683 RepID=A0A9Q0DTM3_9TELE|nr:hypothetical protein NHX12_005708 [Muraenolepis orangiensis]